MKVIGNLGQIRLKYTQKSALAFSAKTFQEETLLSWYAIAFKERKNLLQVFCYKASIETSKFIFGRISNLVLVFDFPESMFDVIFENNIFFNSCI